MLLLPVTFLKNLENNLDAIMKVKNVNSIRMTNLSDRMYAFLRDYKDIGQKEAGIFIRCTIKYIECISSYVNSSKQDISALRQYCKIISVIPKLPEVQYMYLQEISQIILEKVTELVEPIWFVKELLLSYNTALKYFNKDLLHKFISDNVFSLYKLADVLNLCGDYDYQVKILETIFHMCSANQIIEYSRNCFPESIILQNAFRRIQSGNFNFDVRKFLNLINCKNTHVVSIKCERIMLDFTWVGAPKGSIESELWVDFNEGSNTISILCDVDSLKTSFSPNEGRNQEAWELITVHTANVQTVLLSRWLDENFSNSRGAVVCFNLIKPCSVLYASSQQAAQAKQLKFAILNGSALKRLEEHVLPTMFMGKFKRLSPPSSVVQQQQQIISVVETNKKYVEDVRVSVGCDKPPVNVTSLREYDLNSLSFKSVLDEHSDTSHTSFNLQHRAKPNNQRTLIGAHVPIVDELISEDCNSSDASTHLTNCVLGYIDLTVDDGSIHNSSSQTYIQSPQNDYRITTAVYSNTQQYYSIPEANTATVIDLTYSNPNEDLQSNEYFTANEAFVNSNTYNSRGQLLEPVVVENRPLKRLLSIIEEENAVEMIQLNNSLAINQLLEINEADVEIFPSATGKEQPKGVLISTGTFIEDTPKCSPKKKVIKKNSLKAKTKVNTNKPPKITQHLVENVENQHNNHESDEAESPEEIVEQLLSNNEEVTPPQPKGEELATKASEDDRVHVGSFESSDKESLKSSKNLRKSVRKRRKAKACSEIQAEVTSIEIPTKTSLLMSKQPLVILHQLAQEEIGEENHVADSSGDLVGEQASNIKEVAEELVKTIASKIGADNDVEVEISTAEIPFGDKYTQAEKSHQNIDAALRHKQELKKILVIDSNHDEEKTESILVNSLVNTREEVGQKDHEDISVAPLPNVALKKSAVESYENFCVEFEDHLKDSEEYVPVQEETAQNEYPKQNQQSSVTLGDFKLNGDQSHQEKSTNDEEGEILRSEDQEGEQILSGNVTDPKIANKLMTEVSGNNAQNGHLEEDNSISKPNLNEGDQFDSTCKSSKNDPLVTEEITKLNTKVPVVRLARLNVVKDSKTGVYLISNIKKDREVNQSDKDKEISKMTESKPPDSMILSSNNDQNRIKPSTRYDVHTELVLSQSRKYRKRSSHKTEKSYNVEPPTKRKMTHVRKLYNPNDLSYTKFFTEDDFDENTSHYSKSAIENPKGLKGPTNLESKQECAKKTTKRKGVKTKLNSTAVDDDHEKGNATFRWKLKKQTREDEVKMMNNNKENKTGTRVGNEKDDKVAREEYDDILFQGEKQQSGRKRKEDGTIIKNTLGKAQLKRKKVNEELDPFDKILTKEERANSRKLAQTREELCNSRKSNHSTTYQSEAISKSLNYFDLSDFLKELRQSDTTFNATTSNKRRNSSKKKQPNKSRNRSKKLYHTDVMRGKDPHDGYESLYSDVEQVKPPVQHKKPLDRKKKEPKRLKATKIMPISSIKFNCTVQKKTELSPKQQYSNELSPLLELNYEHEMEPLQVESAPRLTSSNSTLQKSPMLKPPKINILSNIVVKTASNNNTVEDLTVDKEPLVVIPSNVYKPGARRFSQASTVVIPLELLKVQRSKRIKSQKTLQNNIPHSSAMQELPSTTNNLEIDNLSAITMESQCTGSSTSFRQIRPTNEDIFNWVSTGLPEELPFEVKNFLECVMSSFKNLVRELLHKMRGPVRADLLGFYELLMRLDNDCDEYFK